MKLTLKFTLSVMAAILASAAAIGVCRMHDRQSVSVRERTIIGADFENTPLDQVLTELCKSAGARLVIDQKNIEQAGIDLRRPVKLHGSGMNLQDALDRALMAGRSGRCGMEWKGNDVRVTPIRTLPLITRVYDIDDLIKSLSESGKSHEIKEILAIYIDFAIDPGFYPSGKPNYASVGGRQMIVSAPAALHRRADVALRALRKLPARPAAFINTTFGICLRLSSPETARDRMQVSKVATKK